LSRLKLKRLEDELNTKGIHVPQDPIKLNDAQEDIHYDKVKSDTQKRYVKTTDMLIKLSKPFHNYQKIFCSSLFS